MMQQLISQNEGKYFAQHAVSAMNLTGSVRGSNFEWLILARGRFPIVAIAPYVHE